MNSSSTITRRLETLLTTLSTPLQVPKCDSFQAGRVWAKKHDAWANAVAKAPIPLFISAFINSNLPPVLEPFLFSQLAQPGIFNSSNFASETNLTDKFAGFMRFNGFLIRRYAAYVFCIAKNLKPELALLEVYGAFKETGKRQRIHASISSKFQDVSNFWLYF